MNPISSDIHLELMLLGGFDARLNGHPVTGISYVKMRALLAYLAMGREQEHSREMLAELLWGDNEPVTARGNLRRTLSHLRSALEAPSGEVMFVATKHSIRFISNAYVDALELNQQSPMAAKNSAPCNEEKIIGLYRGEFLAGLSLSDSPEFETWLLLQREALHRKALGLLEQLANRHAQDGEYSKALQFALRHSELEPWDENTHRSIMRIYALNGQKNAAMRQYEVCCNLIKQELGVLPSEETRRLIDSIRDGELPRRSTDNIVSAPLLLTAERRQATVLYCELTVTRVDDPDELMVQLLQPAQVSCVELIRQFSGHIVQTHGGGLLAYFGYPQAREDAALCALRAALAVTGEATANIAIRVGVHTGLIITNGDTALPDTVGKTSKIAIQLRQQAGYGEVIISQQTYNIVAGYFDCISRGVQTLDDFVQPVEIFTVRQASGARNRLDAAAQLTCFAGRQAEMAKLMALWQETAQGQRHLVLIQGEAGIGKSRLLHALKQALAGQAHSIRELHCFPEFSQSPFHPLIALLDTIFAFAHDDRPAAKSVKLAHYLDSHYPAIAQDAVPLLSRLLSLPLNGHYQALAFSPQKQKDRTMAILLELLQALSMQHPVLLIIEDLHWIDPSTLELLTLFVQQETKGAVLGVFTSRPTFTPPWQAALSLNLMLEQLSDDEVETMLASLTQDMSAEARRRIVERADGIPLFVEEMTKIASLDHQADIPATLHDLLAARIDNMGEAKYTAQLAATLGREFNADVLGKVFPYSPALLAHSLDALQQAGLLLKVNESVRQFKHTLIQEAAYQSQTKVDRQAAHQRIAHTLQQDFPELVSHQPELLAQHLTAGGKVRPAIEYWLKAGQRATLNSANTEAVEHLQAGLRLLMTLPPGLERDRLEFELHLHLGTALIPSKGYGAVEVGEAYSRALELGKAVGGSADLFKALWGMWLTSSSRVGHLHSLELANKLLALATQNNDVLQLQSAHYAMGNSSFMTGNPNAARHYFEHAMALYHPDHHAAMASQYGENICISSGSLLPCTLWLLGFPDQAAKASQQTLDLARQLNHPNSLAYALSAAAILNRWMTQVETTGHLAQQAMALSHEYGFPFWLGLGSISYGWSQAMKGETPGFVKMQQCLEAINSIMSGSTILFLAPLCDVLIHQADFDTALTKINEALKVLDKKDSRFFESEFHCLKGVCLLGLSEANAGEAEACFAQALTVSRKQGALSLALRAAMAMARLWRQQGRQDEAQRLLEGVYNTFTEGFASHDLQEAARFLRDG